MIVLQDIHSQLKVDTGKWKIMRTGHSNKLDTRQLTQCLTFQLTSWATMNSMIQGYTILTHVSLRHLFLNKRLRLRFIISLGSKTQTMVPILMCKLTAAVYAKLGKVRSSPAPANSARRLATPVNQIAFRDSCPHHKREASHTCISWGVWQTVCASYPTS